MKDEKPIIKVTTPRSEKYDVKADIYDSDPKGDHKTIHIVMDTDEGEGHIIDTMDGKTEHTDIKCYLTTACMRFYQNNFNDNCYELNVLRWFRDNFIDITDVEHYYEVAPKIVKKINEEQNADIIYDYIYDNIVDYCVVQIEKDNYDLAYSVYKENILLFETYYGFNNKNIRIKK